MSKMLPQTGTGHLRLADLVVHKHAVNLFGEEDFLSNLSFSVRACLFVDLAAVRFFCLFFRLSGRRVVGGAFFPLRFSLDGDDLS